MIEAVEQRQSPWLEFVLRLVKDQGRAATYFAVYRRAGNGKLRNLYRKTGFFSDSLEGLFEHKIEAH